MYIYIYVYKFFFCFENSEFYYQKTRQNNTNPVRTSPAGIKNPGRGKSHLKRGATRSSLRPAYKENAMTRD